jgi:hypothetical protein
MVMAFSNRFLQREQGTGARHMLDTSLQLKRVYFKVHVNKQKLEK